MRSFASAFCVCLLLAGCATTQTRHTSTSVVDFLYPNVKQPVVAPGTPELRLPLRVGIAFVPTLGSGAGSGLSENRKTEVLNEVAEHFRKSAFVRSIEVIPSPYLRPRAGFANLNQIRTMYGVDVIALVSYDQTQFTDQGLLSLTYWTIVGAYVVKGQKNDTHTMLDTVVYDIPSQKLLFRAPGMSEIKGRATLVNQSEQLRADREAGVKEATAGMIKNLDSQLAAFQAKVKERPDEFRVVRAPEYRGGGMIDELMLGLAVLLASAAWVGMRR